MADFEALENMAGGVLLEQKPAWLEGYAEPLQLLVAATDVLAKVFVRHADPLTATPVDVFPNPDGTGTPLAQPLSPDSEGRLPGYVAQPVALDIYVYGGTAAPRTIEAGFDALVTGVTSVNGHAGIVTLAAADVGALPTGSGLAVVQAPVGDVGPLIQAAYDAGARWISIGGPNTPTLQTPVFFDSAEVNDPVTIHLQGAKLTLSSSLPTAVTGTGGAAFTPDATMRFGFFPGTLRSAFNPTANTVQVVNGGTGGDPAHNTCSIPSAHGYLAEFPTLIIEGGYLDGAGINAGFSFGNGCATSIEHTSFINYKLGTTWVGYVDGNALIHLDFSQPGSPTSNVVGSWGIYQVLPGDGVTIDHVKGGLGYCGVWNAAGNHGGSIRDAIGGVYSFSKCRSIKFSATHVEMSAQVGVQPPVPAIFINNSEVTLDDSMTMAGTNQALPAVSSVASTSSSFTVTFATAHGVTAGAVIRLAGFTPAGYNGQWLVASVTSTTITVTSTLNPGASSVQGTAWLANPMIVISDDTVSTQFSTRLILNGFHAQYWNFLNSDDVRNADVFIAAANPNTVIMNDGSRGGFLNSSSGADYPGGVRLASSDATITAAIVNPTYPSFQKAVVAARRWTLRKGGGVTGTWVIDSTDYGMPYYPQRSAITLFASDPGQGTGTLVNGQNYAYALATLDDDGTWNQVSAELDHVAGTHGAIQITTGNLWTTPTAVVLWRGTPGSVLSAPSAYAILPTDGIAPFYLDTGANVNGIPWVTTGVPIPNTVAATNRTSARTSLPGVSAAVAVVGQALLPSGGDDTAAFNTASRAPGTNGRITLVPGATYTITPALNGGIQPNQDLTVEARGATIKAATGPAGNSLIFGIGAAQTFKLLDAILQGPGAGNFGGIANNIYGVSGNNNATPKEILCLRCQSLGLSFALGLPRSVSFRARWEGGRIDGQGIGTTQNVCTGLQITDTTNVGGLLEVCGGAYLTGLGSSTAAGTGLSHAIYPYRTVSLVLDDVIVDPVLQGDGITPHNGSAPVGFSPYYSYTNLRLTGTNAGFYGVRCGQDGRTKIVGGVFDHPQALLLQGLFEIMGTTLTNSSGNTGVLAQDAAAAPGIGKLVAVEFEAITASIALFANFAGSDFDVIGGKFTGAPTNADIFVNAANRIKSSNSTHSSTGTAAKVTTGTYISRNNHYLGGSDAIRTLTAAPALIASRGDEFSTSGGTAGGLNYSVAPTRETHKDFYGTNAPASET